MKSVLLMFLLLGVVARFSLCSPLSKLRQRRQNSANSDYDLMERYWREPLPLGFFINQGTADEAGGDMASATTNTVRDKIEHSEEGSGEVKRDDIEPKPTSSISLKENNHVAKEKTSTEEVGKLHSSVSADSTKSDPGDKTKVRDTVTCQGQKEWLQCDGPYELIKIKSAFWGRDNDYTCSKSGIAHGLKTDKTCAQDEANTLNKVREACDNENVCEVVASGIYFDKADCADVYKYLKMEWVCAPSESRIKESVS